MCVSVAAVFKIAQLQADATQLGRNWNLIGFHFEFDRNSAIKTKQKTIETSRNRSYSLWTQNLYRNFTQSRLKLAQTIFIFEPLF